MSEERRLSIRWTIGDVSDRGFEALQLSLRGAWKAFGPAAEFVVCVNTVSCRQAQTRTGAVPEGVTAPPWCRSSRPWPGSSISE